MNERNLFIAAEGLQKAFELQHGAPPKIAVDGVSFVIRDGERVGLIGRNGAGKTTLLQLLAGISTPTAGHLKVHGKVTAIFTLGMGLRDDHSGRENIFIEGSLQGKSREETSVLVDEIASFADLGSFLDLPVRTYSTGMKARLAFSTLVYIEPEILIIDEALSVGDAKFATKASAKMKELARKGRILILVSHSMSAITEMCTRCLWVDAGRIRMDGDPSLITRAYVDDVRAADEARLSERFKHQVVNERLKPGWDIESFETRSLLGSSSRTLVTGESAALEATITGLAGTAFEAMLTLCRLDGLVVRQTRYHAQMPLEASTNRAKSRLLADFGPLPLNYGLYRALLEISDETGIAARRSIHFEVINPNPPRGGRPVLIYPTMLNVTKINR